MPYFALEILFQVVMAVHAVNRGRTYPWLWIILFVPVVGPGVYFFVYVVPNMRGPARQPIDRPGLRRVPPGPFAPEGTRPDEPIEVDSPAVIESRARRENCRTCSVPLNVDRHMSVTVGNRVVRAVVMQCTHCEEKPIRYFAVRTSSNASA